MTAICFTCYCGNTGVDWRQTEITVSRESWPWRRKSSTAPTGTRTRDFSIKSPSLYHWAIPASRLCVRACVHACVRACVRGFVGVSESVNVRGFLPLRRLELLGICARKKKTKKNNELIIIIIFWCAYLFFIYNTMWRLNRCSRRLFGQQQNTDKTLCRQLNTYTTLCGQQNTLTRQIVDNKTVDKKTLTVLCGQ